MAEQSRPTLTLTLKAAGVVARHRAVTFGGAQATVAGSKVAGIAATAAADGEHFAVNVGGSVVVESGGGFSAGAGLAVDSQGRAVAAAALTVASGATPVTSTAANGAILTGGELPQFVFADALETASGAGELVEALLRR
jgi:hypothetical protein